MLPTVGCCQHLNKINKPKLAKKVLCATYVTVVLLRGLSSFVMSSFVPRNLRL